MSESNNNEWETVNFGDIVNLKTGKLDSNYAEEGGKYPFFTCAPLPLRINDYAFDCEAILLAGNNANGIFHLNYYKGKFNAYQRTYVIRVKDENRADLGYLYYHLHLSLNMLRHFSQGTSTKFLTMKILNNLDIVLPPIEEQREISKQLSDLDKKIRLSKQMNKTLEAIGQAIFKRWFVDFEFPNEEGEPYKSSGGEMVYNEVLGKEIPKGWEVKNIQDFIVFEKGVEPGSKCYEIEPSEENVRFIRVGDINTPGRDQTYIPIDLCNEKYCNEDDILLSLDATIGIVRIGMKGVHSGGVRRVYSKEKGLIPKGYIYSLLKSKYIQDMIYTYAHGTTILHAGNSLKHMSLAIPRSIIFQKFAKISEPIFNKMVNNLIEIRDLEQIRDSLLPRLMSGKIRVPVEVN